MTHLDSFIDRLPKINPATKHWMVRTRAGDFYDIFRATDKVAIGYDYILPGVIKSAPEKKVDFIKTISPLIQEAIETDSAGVSAGQFFRFYREIKKNDIVLIPSEKSESVLIGVITDDGPELHSFRSEDGTVLCPHIHARSVQWKTEKRRDELNPYINRLFFSHHAVVDATDYADFINGALHDVFIKEASSHLLLEVQTKNRIRARSLFGLFNQLLDEMEEFVIANYPDINVDDIEIRVNLNSPGKVELIAKSARAIAIAGIIVVCIAGGKYKSKDTELSTDGLASTIAAYINENAERKARVALIQSAMSDLEVRDPKEVVQLIKETRNAIHNIPTPVKDHKITESITENTTVTKSE
jgi:restriction system protein